MYRILIAGLQIECESFPALRELIEHFAPVTHPLIPEDDRVILINELRDRMETRVARVIVLVMGILGLSVDTNPRSVIELFLGPLENDIAAILAAYDVRRAIPRRVHGPRHNPKPPAVDR